MEGEGNFKFGDEIIQVNIGCVGGGANMGVMESFSDKVLFIKMSFKLQNVHNQWFLGL